MSRETVKEYAAARVEVVRHRVWLIILQLVTGLIAAGIAVRVLAHRGWRHFQLDVLRPVGKFLAPIWAPVGAAIAVAWAKMEPVRAWVARVWHKIPSLVKPTILVGIIVSILIGAASFLPGGRSNAFPRTGQSERELQKVKVDKTTKDDLAKALDRASTEWEESQVLKLAKAKEAQAQKQLSAAESAIKKAQSTSEMLKAWQKKVDAQKENLAAAKDAVKALKAQLAQEEKDAAAAKEASSKPAPKPAPKPATSKPAGPYHNYTVKAGDTVSAIASLYGTSVEDIAALNNLGADYLINVGQVLKVNGTAPTTPAPSTPKPAPSTKVTSGSPQEIAKSLLSNYGWGQDQFQYVDYIFTHESGWNPWAVNPSSGAYGIPQANPAGGQGYPYELGDAYSQIVWGLNYIQSRYGTPYQAYQFWLSHNWY